MGRRSRFNKRNPRKLETNEEKDKDKNKNKDQKIICHNCRKPDHVRYECPLLKSSDKKKLKRAMFGAWTDNESSSSSSSEEEQQSNLANFCLMAHQEDEEPSSESICFVVVAVFVFACHSTARINKCMFVESEQSFCRFQQQLLLRSSVMSALFRRRSIDPAVV